MTKFLKFYFYFMISLGILAMLLSAMESDESKNKKIVEKKQRKIQQKKQNDKSMSNLARVIFIKITLENLKKESQNIKVTTRDVLYLKNTAKKLFKAIDEDKKDLQWNKKTKQKINSWVDKISSNQIRYEKVLKSVDEGNFDETIKLLNLKLIQDLLIIALKENDIQLATKLINRIDLNERFFKKDKPLVLVSKMKDKHKDEIIDLLLSKDFNITKPQSTTVLLNILKKYKKQTCINQDDYKRAKNIVEFLDNHIYGYSRLYDDRKLSKELLENITKIRNKRFDLTNLHYWDVKELYKASIKNGCLRLLDRLVTSDEHKSLIDVTLAVTEQNIFDKKQFDKNRYTPLTYAIKNKNIEAIKILLQNGANPNRIVNKYKTSPIQDCNINFECAKVLFEYGAKLNVRNKIDDLGVIDEFAYAGNLEAVKYFLEKGANPNLGKRKARDLAQKQGYDDVVKIIDDFTRKKQ